MDDDLIRRGDAMQRLRGYLQGEDDLICWDVEQIMYDIPRADLAQAPAPVRVKPLIFSEFTEGGCMGRPHPFQYFITQAHNGKFLCHHDTTWHETLKAAQDHAQADYQRAALEAPDAGVVAELVEAHRENARVLSHMHNDLQGRVDATKLAALFECLARSTAALALIAHNTTEG